MKEVKEDEKEDEKDEEKEKQKQKQKQKQKEKEKEEKIVGFSSSKKKDDLLNSNLVKEISLNSISSINIESMKNITGSNYHSLNKLISDLGSRRRRRNSNITSSYFKNKGIFNINDIISYSSSQSKQLINNNHDIFKRRYSNVIVTRCNSTQNIKMYKNNLNNFANNLKSLKIEKANNNDKSKSNNASSLNSSDSLSLINKLKNLNVSLENERSFSNILKNLNKTQKTIKSNNNQSNINNKSNKSNNNLIINNISNNNKINNNKINNNIIINNITNNSTFNISKINNNYNYSKSPNNIINRNHSRNVIKRQKYKEKIIAHDAHTSSTKSTESIFYYPKVYYINNENNLHKKTHVSTIFSKLKAIQNKNYM